MLTLYLKLKDELAGVRDKSKRAKGELEAFRTWLNSITTTPPINNATTEGRWREAVFPKWMETSPGSMLFAALSVIKQANRSTAVQFLIYWTAEGVKEGPSLLNVRVRACCFLATCISYYRHLQVCSAITWRSTRRRSNRNFRRCKKWRWVVSKLPMARQ